MAGRVWGYRVLLETIFFRSLILCIWPDSEPTKLADHPKQNLGGEGAPNKNLGGEGAPNKNLKGEGAPNKNLGGEGALSKNLGGEGASDR